MDFMQSLVIVVIHCTSKKQSLVEVTTQPRQIEWQLKCMLPIGQHPNLFL